MAPILKIQLQDQLLLTTEIRKDENESDIQTTSLTVCLSSSTDTVPKILIAKPLKNQDFTIKFRTWSGIFSSFHLFSLYSSTVKCFCSLPFVPRLITCSLFCKYIGNSSWISFNVWRLKTCLLLNRPSTIGTIPKCMCGVVSSKWTVA